MTERNRETIAKVLVVGDDRPRTTSNATPDPTETAFGAAQALDPPYNPITLAEIYENSGTLRPNVDAYVQNIDSNGWHLEPVLDLDGDDAYEIVGNAMRLERLDAIDRGMVVESAIPTDTEIAARMAQIESAMELERFRIDAFFSGCTVEESFTSLRRKTRQDLEVCGNAYWEVLRDSAGRVVQFVYMPAHTIRLRKLEAKLVDVVVPIRQSPITVSNERLRRRFRSMVQIADTLARPVFFKELGDPRAMSSATGMFYDSALELSAKEPGATPATEILHFRIHSPRTPYGVPRWIGALLSVLGSREAEEVNLLYFENKSVPPMAVLVSGGRLGSESTDRLRDFIENEIKGKGNFHKILVIEAEPSDTMSENNGRMKIEIKPLTQAQQQDALFLKYDERNHDKVGFTFRIPRLLRGDVRDFNRATADAAIEFAESQVFGPERNEFDFTINRLVLSTLGVRYWTFRSNSVQVRDPKVLSTMIAELTTANVLVPADSRKLAAELVFNRRLPRIDADWVNQPVMLTQVGVPLDTTQDGVIPTPAPAAAPTAGQPAPVARARGTHAYGVKREGVVALAASARELLRLREQLEVEETREAEERVVAAAKAERDGDPEVVRFTMSPAAMTARFGVVPK